ncbi:growth hormone secretagogue receptor type 1-like [Artemia franciscana]|uniref:growth hormone secretagogue receptor type 1-like n=1 Tax=Artemia franciscana TaxID=6661 RepID=UPI0032DB8E0C
MTDELTMAKADEDAQRVYAKKLVADRGSQKRKRAEESKEQQGNRLEAKERSLVPFIEMTVAHVSVLTIIAISVERYYVVTKPLRAGYTCTRMRALLIVGGVWFFGTLITCPLLVIAQFDPGKDSAPTCFTYVNTFWPSFYFTTVISLLYIIPLVMLIVIYCVISSHLVATPYSLQGRQSENSNLRARKQVVAMLAAVVVCFFLCLLPFRIFTLWIIFVKEADIQSLGFHTYYNILNFCRVMQYINSAINPVLYNLMSSKFRDAFSRALGITFGNKKIFRFTSHPNTFNTGSTGSSSLSKSKIVDPALGVTQLVPQPFITRYGRQGRYVCANKYFQRQSSTGSVLNSETSIKSSKTDELRILNDAQCLKDYDRV